MQLHHTEQISRSSLLTRRTNNSMRLKLKSMPLCENKLIKDVKNSYKVKNYYTILSTIGWGTYAKVYLAKSKTDNSTVAIKCSKGATSGEMLRKEYEILRSFDDPLIPKAIEFNKSDLYNTSYLVMEYFKGQTLEDFILEKGTLQNEQALAWLKTLASCVDRLHKLGIAHRDIKPQNILINGKFEVKLIDFNISKKGKDSENSSKFTKRFMTQVSSPLFAAPEIYSPDCYSESVDIWGLGIVFITMIFGMKIFSGKNIQSWQIKHQKFIDTVQLDESSDIVKYIISISLAYTPEDRATASELSACI